MPHSDTDNNIPSTNSSCALAVVAESLYLINLLLLPGIAFMILGGLYLRYRKHPNDTVACHLKQTFIASLWAGVLIILLSGLMVLIGGHENSTTWVVVVLYFTLVHATLVIMGAFGLARAINKQHYHFYLIGPACDFYKQSDAVGGILGE